MGGIAGVDTYNHRYTAQLNMGVSYSKISCKCKQIFYPCHDKGKTGGKKVFMYCDGSYMSFGNRNIRGWTYRMAQEAIAIWLLDGTTLAVGSYVSANITGSGYQEGTIGDIKLFLILWRDARWQDNA